MTGTREFPWSPSAGRRQLPADKKRQEAQVAERSEMKMGKGLARLGDHAPC